MCCLRKASSIESLKKRQDFKRVYSQGKYAADTFFVVYALANGLHKNRLGLTVSKKVGCAVVRNRVKRWARESYRAKVGQVCGYDFVFIARTSSGELTGKGAYEQVSKSITGLFKRLSKKMELKIADSTMLKVGSIL